MKPSFHSFSVKCFFSSQRVDGDQNKNCTRCDLGCPGVDVGALGDIKKVCFTEQFAFCEGLD